MNWDQPQKLNPDIDIKSVNHFLLVFRTSRWHLELFGSLSVISHFRYPYFDQLRPYEPKRSPCLRSWCGNGNWDGADPSGFLTFERPPMAGSPFDVSWRYLQVWQDSVLGLLITSYHHQPKKYWTGHFPWGSPASTVPSDDAATGDQALIAAPCHRCDKGWGKEVPGSNCQTSEMPNRTSQLICVGKICSISNNSWRIEVMFHGSEPLQRS